MNGKEMLNHVIDSIKNPSLTEQERIIYAGRVLKCMALVADRWMMPPEEVFDIIERIENDPVNLPMWEPDRDTLDDDHKIFWDFIQELEPFTD